MALGVHLLARFESRVDDAKSLFDRTADWISRKYPELFPKMRQGHIDGHPTLFVHLHPAAEEVEFSLIDPEQLVASANTSSVGPGYHIFLCSLLKDWAGEFHALWQEAGGDSGDDSGDYLDDTDYFFTGIEQDVFDNMTAWLAAVAGTFFEKPIGPDEHGLLLSMSPSVLFETDQLAVTPLGPRDFAWLKETSQDGSRGRDFFAWWTPGINAEYYLGRALADMWPNVRWRAPINDAERRILREVADSLRNAYNLDARLPYPWTEWREILGYLGESRPEIDAVRSHPAVTPTIGYRRLNVTEYLPGGWRLRLPGSFSEFQPDDEHNFFALDPQREIWFTSYSFTAESPDQTFASTRQSIRESQPEFLQESENYIGKAAIREVHRETGENYFVLNSSNVTLNHRAVCSVIFLDQSQKDWALELWRSIRPPSNPQPVTVTT